jgi:DNA-binding HxlR family transcriptional regulator
MEPMKTANAEYSFSETELEILEEIAKGKHEFSSVETALSVSPSLLSYNLQKLQNKGLTKTTKTYKKQVFFTDFKHAIILKDLLSSYEYVDWDKILSGKALKILFQLLSKYQGNLPNIPKNTLWRHLKKLKARGIVTPTNTINPQFSLLIEFLREYQKFFTSKRANSVSENAIIIWQEDMEFLMRVPNEIKPSLENFFKTAISVFPQYNLPLFSEFDYYFYSTKKKMLKLEDVLLNTLLIEPANVRYTTYALLLLKKTQCQIDKTYLLQEAVRFGLTNKIINMFQFLDTHIQPNDHSLPKWNEFIEKANNYGVKT